MDEYLSEKEQLEQIRQWWSDYGWYVLGGVAIGLAGLFGYGRYQDAMNASSETAAALYEQFASAVDDDDRAQAGILLDQLNADHAASPYAANAELMLARMLLVSDPDRAIAALRNVMNTSDDAELALIARLRLARVLAWQENHDEALTLLEIDNPGAFAARIEEIRGDILLASGDVDGARVAWTSAMIVPGSESIDRSFLQMKLSNLMQPVGLLDDDAQVLEEVDLGALPEETADDSAPAQPDAAEAP